MEDSREDLRALAKKKKDPAAQRRAVKQYIDGRADTLRAALVFGAIAARARDNRYEARERQMPDIDSFARRMTSKLTSLCAYNDRMSKEMADLVKHAEHLDDDAASELGLKSHFERFSDVFTQPGPVADIVSCL